MARQSLVTLSVFVLSVAAVSSADAPPPFLLMWGSPGSGIGQFDSSYLEFLATDQFGNVYVPDFTGSPTYKSRVQIFDADGTFVRQFLSPHSVGTFMGIAVDAKGDVLVANDGCYRVEKYSNRGDFLRMWGWGVDTGASAFEICTSGCQCGIGGDGDGQLGNPRGDLATDADRNVYVVDRPNQRVMKYDPLGNFLRTWGWGVNTGASTFEICTSDCQAGIAGTSNGQFDLPTGIEVSGENVYVTDWNNPGRVQIFSRSGAFQAAHVVGYSASGIDVTPDGDMYVALYWGDRISTLDSSGTEVATWGASGTGIGQFTKPEGLALGPDGSVFVLDKDNARIQKFGPALNSFKADLLARPETRLTVAESSRE
jgi:sugar lactone lactonase YvrE